MQGCETRQDVRHDEEATAFFFLILVILIHWATASWTSFIAGVHAGFQRACKGGMGTSLRGAGCRGMMAATAWSEQVNVGASWCLNGMALIDMVRGAGKLELRTNRGSQQQKSSDQLQNLHLGQCIHCGGTGRW